MNLTLRRIANKPTYTIGRLYVDGKYLCDVLEDYDRGLDDRMDIEEIKKIKVYGQTAIPTGTYRILMTYSPKYKKIMPLISGVKGFEGIRIHSGNTDKDTLGCLIVGKNNVVGMVTDSRNTYKKLFDILWKETDKILITIERTYNVSGTGQATKKK